MRHKPLKIAAVLALVAIAAGAALPGPQQAFAPRWNGLGEIAPGVWTDDLTRSDALSEMLAQGLAPVVAFYGETPPLPRTILCSTSACAERFMGQDHPSGRTYGAELMVFAPQGLSRVVIAHEIAHVALHRTMNGTDLIFQRFPAWFDEGLASWIAGDTRLTPPDDVARARLLEARHFTSWGGVMEDLGWKAGYGAAMALVEEMVAAAGPDGLRALIERVEAGADFDAERAALLAGSDPG